MKLKLENLKDLNKFELKEEYLNLLKISFIKFSFCYESILMSLNSILHLISKFYLKMMKIKFLIFFYYP
jgi:hypothetical protein